MQLVFSEKSLFLVLSESLSRFIFLEIEGDNTHDNNPAIYIRNLYYIYWNIKKALFAGNHQQSPACEKSKPRRFVLSESPYVYCKSSNMVHDMVYFH